MHWVKLQGLIKVRERESGILIDILRNNEVLISPSNELIVN